MLKRPKARFGDAENNPSQSSALLKMSHVWFGTAEKGQGGGWAVPAFHGMVSAVPKSPEVWLGPAESS